MNDRADRRVLSASRRRRSRRPFAERFEERVLLSTFTVDKTADSGLGTLRQAILDSNSMPAPAGQSNAIDFEIGVGDQVIQPTSALPTITATVAIDTTTSMLGSSQTVELQGVLTGAAVDGLTIEASGVVIAGLAIESFSAGILIEGGGGSLIQGDSIGVDPFGQERGNGHEGVLIVGSDGNTIGGSAVGGNNVIAANGGNGLTIEGGSSGNLVQFNEIGVNADGEMSLRNLGNGVAIVDSPGNQIGSVGGGNLITTNAGDGVLISGAGSSGNLVYGNGLGSVSSTLGGNEGAGVEIDGAPNNTIGGLTPNLEFLQINTIAANSIGVLIHNAGASGNLVEGNLIGTQSSLDFAGNFGPGVEIDGASGNTIGGATGGTLPDGTVAANQSSNIISGNSGEGILLTAGSTASVIQGNFIGTNVLGVSLVANNGVGLEIRDTSGNTVGGTSGGAGNTIANEFGPALQIDGAGASGNLVEGNQLGLGGGSSGQGSSTGPLSSGVLIDGAPRNTIGGTIAGAGNTITNNGSGVAIQGDSAVGTLIEGNLIGVAIERSASNEPISATVTATAGNSFYGIEILGGSATTIGGTASGARNVISANGSSNVLITGDLGPTSGNLILGNYIGTDITGTGNLTDLNDGILIVDSPDDVVMDDVISGNGGNGLSIYGSLSAGAVVQGNKIGIDSTGLSAIPNKGDGLAISGVPGVLVGGTALGAGNVISGNGMNGVEVSIGSAGVVLLGNRIGTDASGGKALPNSANGVLIGDSAGVVVGGIVAGSANQISGNGGSGVRIEGAGSSGAIVLGNRIGVDANGLDSVPNAGDGVLINGASGVAIGGTAPGSGNVLSGNLGNGVHVLGPGASGEIVEGNVIGLDPSGTFVLPNAGDGVFLDGASSNTVGGTAVGSRNTISGNTLNGIEIAGAGATDNVILGNLIGATVDYLNPSVTHGLAVGNKADGVKVDGNFGASGNTIGGTAAGSGNVITGNIANGVEISKEGATLPDGDVIIGNIIGLDTSTGAPRGLANDQNGVSLVDSTGIRVGGSTVAERNLISGNAQNGVQLYFSQSNLVEGNDIGSDASGLIDYGNSGDGIRDLNGVGNAIGGPGAGQGNLIFGNGGAGIAINSSTGDVVRGNTIGLNAIGSLYSTIPNHDGTLHSLGNNEDGVSINAGGGSTIGGPDAGDGNVISGNFKNGITVVNAGNGNLIQGNNVGLDPTGLIGRGNRLNGIYITTSDNTIGGTVAGSGNVVSGNLNSGVVLSTLTASRNLVEGNLIGTNVLGGDNPNGGDPSNGIDGLPIGNRLDGVFVNDDAVGNTIGGTSSGARNVISGNGSDGVQILDINVQADPNLSTPPGDVVAGNDIGTDARGLIADSNAAAGVFVYNARNNTVGLSGVGGGNLISGNLGSGVAIQGEAATGNVVLADQIGTDVTGGFALPNRGDGVTVVEAPGNRIGGLGAGEANLILYNGNAGVSISSESDSAVVAGNVISANGGDGVSVASGSNFSLIAGNRIGTDATGEIGLGNGLDGVRLTDAGLGSLVLSNVIADNSGAGVEVTGTSSTAVIQANLIGLDAQGKLALGNAVGVAINGVPDVVVGSLAPGLGNVISGNSVGVQVNAGSNTSLGLGDLIVGNVIGLDASGTKALGNVFGVFLNDAVGVTIGGTTPAARNVISGNTGAGVQVFRVSVGGSGNLIEGNTIGLDFSGMAVPTGAVQPIGVFLNASSNNTVGGTTPGSGNLISGNTTGNTTAPGYGISIFGQSGGLALDNVVEGNRIGTNVVGGALPLFKGSPVQTIGVVINTSAGNLIGGLTPSARNLIEGNVVGVEVVGIVEKFPGQPTGNLIVGDTVDANTFGVYINEAQGNAILDNDLSRNTSIGLSIVGSLATGNTATGNVIDANLQHGVYIEAAASNGVQGATPNLIARNEISGNSQVGVYIALQANGNQVRRNTIRKNKQYGIFLYNAAGNLGAVPRTGPDMNQISGSGIADFREFTGPLTKTTAGSSTPKGPKVKKKSR